MRFHGLVFPIEPPNDFELDSEFVSYVSAISSWDLSDCATYFKTVESRYPVTMWEPVKDKDFKSMVAVSATKIYYPNGGTRDFGMLVVQSALIDADPAMLPMLISINEAVEQYKDVALSLSWKLKKRT